ncbi:hypothetical protein ACEQ8H_006440 [Pleosporales sp. CAS-2024a]
MSSTTFLVPLLLGILMIPSSHAQSSTTCPNDPARCVEDALNGLGQWYNLTTGLWETAGWWNNANIMTTLGNLAEADPYNAAVQKQVRRTFFNAIGHATIKNPAPNKERPPKPKSTSPKMVQLGKPYSKHLDPITYLPHSDYPESWFLHAPSAGNSINLLINDQNFLPENTLRDFTPDPYDWLDGYYDDDLWWALAWIGAYDLDPKPVYLNLAKGIFDIVAKGWGTNCGHGGIYWSDAKQYVNAIANELFFSTAAHLANRVDDKATYAAWAEKSLKWFLSSGMRNKNGTINDGLDGTKCKNNGKTVWSYNQGVILGGLVEFDRATSNATLLHIASDIASAALKALSDADGVIHDVCDQDGTCGADGVQFKGVFIRNLGELWSATGNDKFKAAINTNARSIWKTDKQEDKSGVVFGNKWAGPFEGPANAAMQGSAMDALVANVVIAQRKAT